MAVPVNLDSERQSQPLGQAISLRFTRLTQHQGKRHIRRSQTSPRTERRIPATQSPWFVRRAGRLAALADSQQTQPPGIDTLRSIRRFK